VNLVEYSIDSDEEHETIASAEWIQNNKKPVTCPFEKKEPKSYEFDVTKANNIFDLLLSEGLIKLNKTIPQDPVGRGTQGYEVLQVAQFHIS